MIGQVGRLVRSSSFTYYISSISINNLQEKDLAIADITINLERSTFVVFSVPFMYDYVNIFFKATPPGLNLWYFMKPLHLTVVFTLVAALFISGLGETICEDIRNGRRVSVKSLLNNGNFVRIMFEQSICGCSKRGSQMCMLAAAWMGAVIVLATFKGNLLTFLGNIKNSLINITSTADKKFYIEFD